MKRRWASAVCSKETVGGGSEHSTAPSSMDSKIFCPRKDIKPLKMSKKSAK